MRVNKYVYVYVYSRSELERSSSFRVLRLVVLSVKDGRKYDRWMGDDGLMAQPKTGLARHGSDRICPFRISAPPQDPIHIKHLTIISSAI